MDSFVPQYPIFHALVLKPFMCLAFVGLTMCMLHNWSHLKAAGGGCARPAACPVCEQVQAPPAHSRAGLGTHCPTSHEAVFFLSVTSMENFS